MFAQYSLIALSATALFCPALIRADCECGYVVDDLLYTDLIETDFLHSDKLSADWVAEESTTAPDGERNPYGKHFSPDNVVANPLKSKDTWSGTGTNGGDAGLQLIVRGGIPESRLIPTAEIVSQRKDVKYGSFRAGMKLTNVNGTCGAFFFYRNDTQEIDMEFLSKECNETSHPVNLVLQSPASLRAGFDASTTKTFFHPQLPFAPHDAFHEYRFDWHSDSVSFYADGKVLQTTQEKTAIPTDEGQIHLSQWSNGDGNWSAGPPEVDAIVTVSYFKGYFNSSRPERQEDFFRRCKDPKKANAVCTVPQTTSAPNGNKTYFFTLDQNKTPNQTTNGKQSSASSWRGIDNKWSWLLPVFSTCLVVSLMCL